MQDKELNPNLMDIKILETQLFTYHFQELVSEKGKESYNKALRIIPFR